MKQKTRFKNLEILVIGISPKKAISSNLCLFMLWLPVSMYLYNF